MIEELKTFLSNYWVKDVIESITYLENDENNHITNQEIICTANHSHSHSHSQCRIETQSNFNYFKLFYYLSI